MNSSVKPTNSFTAFLKLVRLPNLLIIVVAQYAMRWGVIYPIYRFLNQSLVVKEFNVFDTYKPIEFCVSELYFFLLSLSTVMIAAAGYIINDYFDVRIDRINKPTNMIIDKGIKRRTAMLAHLFLNGLAIIIAFFVSYQLGLTSYVQLFIVCAVGLWFYSTDFKRQLLIGNFIVALFIALVPLLVGIYELQLAAKQYNHFMQEPYGVNFKAIFNFIVGFSVLAFVINFIREILKDIEDVEGDRQYGCKTIPIVWGIPTAKVIVVALSLITMCIIGYIQKEHFAVHAYASVIYLLLAIQLPLITIIVLTLKAATPKQFKLPDTISKLTMLAGIGYCIVIYFSFIPK